MIEDSVSARSSFAGVRGERMLTPEFGHFTPSDLPSPPQAAARIIQACSDPTVSAQALARIVENDPVLVAEILKTVNSAYFGLGRSIASAAQAVTVLGNRALRNLALCLAVRDAVKADAIPGLDITSYWEDALRRAVSARLLSATAGVNGDEAFTLGLIQDFGMLVMLFVRRDATEAWRAVLRPAHPVERLSLEAAHFGTTHVEVGKLLADTWLLPPQLSVPIAYHHATDFDAIPLAHRSAAQLAMAADACAAVFSCTQIGMAHGRCVTTLATLFGLSSEQVDRVLEQVPGEVEQAAKSLGLRISEQKKLEDVLQLANTTLAQINLENQKLVWQLEQSNRKLEATLVEKERAHAEVLRLANQLKEANARLEQLAFFDPLTGLMNRRRFGDVLLAEVRRHGRNGHALTFVMIDLDHFKSVNDTYGHPFGDHVLENVARAWRHAPDERPQGPHRWRGDVPAPAGVGSRVGQRGRRARAQGDHGAPASGDSGARPGLGVARWCHVARSHRRRRRGCARRAQAHGGRRCVAL